ncbi:MAG: hypothetical protein NVS3B17_07630 [Vulcanimicrobiaceae bacterium]
MADFQNSFAAFQADDVDVVAASVDSLADTRKLVESERIAFPVGYGLDAEAVAKKLGGFYQNDPDGAYLQPANFVLDPDGRVVSATYSSAAIGRLTAQDARSYIAHHRK